MWKDDYGRMIDAWENDVIALMRDIIPMKPLSPGYGGEGEMRKAEYLQRKLEELGLVVERYDVTDEWNVERPNVVAYLPGRTERKLWIVAHMDVVPPGDPSLWETDPWEAVVKDGKIYGRGAEDNNHAIAASYMAARCLVEAGEKGKYTLALAYVADEELGSTYGIKHLVERGLFSPDDLILVPDAGAPDGSFIEVAEKSGIWLKVVTHGVQAHASRPHKGVNAHRYGMKFALMLDEILHSRYVEQDPMFDPPYSTFEVTKKEANVENINTIPGTDVVYFDMRLLPSHPVAEVLELVERARRGFEEMYGVKVSVEVVRAGQSPPPTPADADVVIALKRAIKELRGIEPVVGGIGGGTCAAFFRAEGLHAAVWSTIDETAHQPNEYTKIKNVLEDAKVYAYMVLGG